MLKKIIIFFIVLLVAGCASAKWVPVRIDTDIIEGIQSDSISTKSYEKNYKIGEKRTAFIGQEIIRIQPYQHIKTKSIPFHFEKYALSHNPVYIEWPDKLRTYKIESIASKDYQIKDSVAINNQRFNIIYIRDNNQYQWGILMDDDGELFKSAVYSYDYNSMLYSTSISIKPAKFVISTKKITESESESEQRIDGPPFELIYAGKNNVMLNVTYREYTADNIARTAFFQNITYQANAKEIRFKDFSIQIHNSSNEKIIYTVLEDGLKDKIEFSSNTTSP